ncbi:hypothetical protein [Leptolyngbya sp. NK1-12]|uniref:hypothetical protein n=1 Tax=Leptolyngbya sp. NK1-12 TaxID=2547451 RepID=UPI003B63F324
MQVVGNIGLSNIGLGNIGSGNIGSGNIGPHLRPSQRLLRSRDNCCFDLSRLSRELSG